MHQSKEIRELIVDEDFMDTMENIIKSIEAEEITDQDALDLSLEMLSKVIVPDRFFPLLARISQQIHFKSENYLLLLINKIVKNQEEDIEKLAASGLFE